MHMNVKVLVLCMLVKEWEYCKSAEIPLRMQMNKSMDVHNS